MEEGARGRRGVEAKEWQDLSLTGQCCVSLLTQALQLHLEINAGSVQPSRCALSPSHIPMRLAPVPSF